MRWVEDSRCASPPGDVGEEERRERKSADPYKGCEY
jgi:hypothetical protein